MAVTKTNFINWTRCPRYIALERIKKERLTSDVSYKDYQDEELKEHISELIGGMFEVSTTEEGNDAEIDLVDVKNRQLEIMMPYYKKVEQLAAIEVAHSFGGKTIYAEETKKQECFDFSSNGIRYLCYVDIYNENEKGINIVEVKATTTNKYLSLGGKLKGKEFSSIFYKKDNILYLKDELVSYNIENDMPLKTYEAKRNTLFNRFKEGKYVYDLAIQRFIIENELRQSSNPKINKINYYLAVLNHEYIYDGKSNYLTDEFGNEIITLIDLTKVTEEMQIIIEEDKKKLEKYLFNEEASPCPLSSFCEYKKTTECKYFKPICGHNIPKNNSSLTYMNNGFGFNVNDERKKGLELINEGFIDLLDVPEEWIKNPNHFIQRNAYKFQTPYINKDKLHSILNMLEYPIYHLDFETFPCPIPRFRGERPYTQSPFEFSLHIEKEPSLCDKEKDNIVFLAKTHKDEREELVKELLRSIDSNKGTLFAQNVSFEKSRIKELAEVFPKYKKDLMKIYERGFDLIWILRNKNELFKELGYEKEEISKVNYYDYRFSGSYSIKKTLPVFSDLSYNNLDVKNGTDAIVEYARYQEMSPEEFNLKYEALKEYCKQDTWAMVVILNAIRELINKKI